MIAGHVYLAEAEANPEDPRSENLEQIEPSVHRGTHNAAIVLISITEPIWEIQLAANYTNMGLSALTELAASIEERYNIECYFSSHGDIDLTNNFAATHLFRIAARGGQQCHQTWWSKSDRNLDDR